jgi:hypothetical protein
MAETTVAGILNARSGRIAKEADVMIYAIGIYDRLFETKKQRLGPTLLADLSDLTGGRDFVIENSSDLVDVANKIGIELRNLYVLSDMQRHRARRQVAQDQRQADAAKGATCVTGPRERRTLRTNRIVAIICRPAMRVFCLGHSHQKLPDRTLRSSGTSLALVWLPASAKSRVSFCELSAATYSV